MECFSNYRAADWKEKNATDSQKEKAQIQKAQIKNSFDTNHLEQAALLLVASILNAMKNFFKKLDKKHLAVFLPLTIAAYLTGGITPMFVIATVTGFGYIAWQVIAND